jgi:hypothetical protein
MSKLTISVVADDEVRVSTGQGEAQKMFNESETADPTLFWSPKWVREIVSYLVTSEYMQKRYREYINYIIWTAFRVPDFPDHGKLVFATKLLLGKWMSDCAADETCLAPPSRRMLQDDEMKKVLTSYMSMSKKIANAKATDDWDEVRNIKTNV